MCKHVIACVKINAECNAECKEYVLCEAVVIQDA